MENLVSYLLQSTVNQKLENKKKSLDESAAIPVLLWRSLISNPQRNSE